MGLKRLKQPLDKGSSERIRTRKERISVFRVSETEICKIKTTIKMPDEKKERGEKENNIELAELLKLLTIRNDSHVSAETFEKIIPECNGTNIKCWFENYKKNAEAYNSNYKQKYIHARNKMNGIAKLFLETIAVGDYDELKDKLYAKFYKEADSAEIHQSLRSRRKKPNETFYEYVLEMKKRPRWAE